MTDKITEDLTMLTRILTAIGIAAVLIPTAIFSDTIMKNMTTGGLKG